MLLTIKNATKYLGSKTILDNINIQINENEIIGIVGRNGCGKTTLLKIISEQLHLDKGTITKNGNVSIGYLNQTVFEDEEAILKNDLENIFNHLKILQTEIEQLSYQLYNDENIQQYEKKLNQFEMQGGYQYQHEIKTLLTKFGFSENDLLRKIKEFSGGQKTKLALIKLLLLKPDILLLDEPTNHLDLSTIMWLETYLKNYKKTIVIVSHDRMFLNTLCQIIYEIEYGELSRYSGNYDQYLVQKKQRKDKQHQSYLRQQEEINRLEEMIEKFRYKKNKAKFAQSKIKYLERLEKISDVKKEEKVFKLNFTSAIKSGKKVLECDELAIGYKTILATLSLEVYNQERIAIMGDNGTGKTTLLKTLSGKITPLSGDYLFGHNTTIGYYDQEFKTLNDENTIIEEIWDSFPELDQNQIRTLLATFLFKQEEVFKKIAVLSLGEKARVALLKLMLAQDNVLLLDEPTNHLDIPSKEMLETALTQYDGTIIFVSHDRYFIEKIANKKLQLINGVSEKVQSTEITPPTKKEKPIRLSKEIKKIENKINVLEQEIQQLTQQQFLEEVYLNADKMKKIEEMIKSKKHILTQLMDEWEQLQYSN